MTLRGDDITRRAFLRVTAAAGGGLLLISTPLGCLRSDPGDPPDGPIEPLEFLNAYVLIGPDGSVVIRAPCPEIGQGVRTSLPMIVAEELGARWEDLRFEQAPADDRYGGMSVGGSDSVTDYWEPLRDAGAVGRALLIGAAAERWGVPETECAASDGLVRHTESGRSLGFGELVDRAAELPVPESPPLVDESAFRIVGLARGPVDAASIVRGQAEYGLDVRMEGMLYAVVERAPVHGAKLIDFDAAAAREIPGVVDVVPVAGRAIRGFSTERSAKAWPSWPGTPGRRSRAGRRFEPDGTRDRTLPNPPPRSPAG